MDMTGEKTDTFIFPSALRHSPHTVALSEWHQWDIQSSVAGTHDWLVGDFGNVSRLIFQQNVMVHSAAKGAVHSGSLPISRATEEQLLSEPLLSPRGLSGGWPECTSVRYPASTCLTVYPFCFCLCLSPANAGHSLMPAGHVCPCLEPLG